MKFLDEAKYISKQVMVVPDVPVLDERSLSNLVGLMVVTVAVAGVFTL